MQEISTSFDMETTKMVIEQRCWIYNMTIEIKGIISENKSKCSVDKKQKNVT